MRQQIQTACYGRMYQGVLKPQEMRHRFAGVRCPISRKSIAHTDWVAVVVMDGKPRLAFANQVNGHKVMEASRATFDKALGIA